MPPYNGNGTFSPPPADYPAVTGTVINSSKRNAIDNDFSNGLTNCVTRDGQSPATADIPLGGYRLTNVGNGTASGDAANVAQLNFSAAVVGSSRNSKMIVSAEATSATFTADEVVTATALGGLTYKRNTISHVIDLTITGAGGMDTGTAPVSGYVAIYLIYNPTTPASALLAVNATAAVAPEVYGGVNMPAGYTSSALVSVWPTNASSQFKVGSQIDRRINFANTIALNTTTGAPTYTSLSLSGIVPKNARKIGGVLTASNATNVSMSITIAMDALGNGAAAVQIGSGLGGTYDMAASYAISVSTPQTVFYTYIASGASSAIISVSSYEF